MHSDINQSIMKKVNCTNINVVSEKLVENDEKNLTVM